MGEDGRRNREKELEQRKIEATGIKGRTENREGWKRDNGDRWLREKSGIEKTGRMRRVEVGRGVERERETLRRISIRRSLLFSLSSSLLSETHRRFFGRIIYQRSGFPGNSEHDTEERTQGDREEREGDFVGMRE